MKVTVDKALIERAVEALEKERPYLGPAPNKVTAAITALRAALAEPAVEPGIGRDALTVNLMRLAGLDKHTARKCADVVGLMLAAPTPPAQPAVEPTCKPPLQVHKPTGWMAHKNQYAVPVLFNPYTGEPRDVRDVQSDPQGVLIVPPGKVEMIAASPPPPAEVPLLSDEEVGMLTVYGGLHHVDVPLLAEFVRHIESTIRRKAGLA